MNNKSITTFMVYFFLLSIIYADAAKVITHEDLATAIKNENHEKTIEYAKALANGANDPLSQMILGEYYFEGKGGIRKDYLEAYKWFKMASDQNVLSAHNYIGTMYEEGLGLKKDCNKAIHYYNKASNHPTGQYSLGMIYKNGSCVKQDLSKSIYWFTKAAEQGFEPAVTKLTELNVISENEAKLLLKKEAIGCYYNDEKTKYKSEELFDRAINLISNRGDSLEISKFLSDSALMGNPRALVFYCIFKTDPEGIPSFWKEGYAWCQIANEMIPLSYTKEHSKLKKILNNLDSQLSATDRSKGEKIKQEIKSQMSCK